VKILPCYDFGVWLYIVIRTRDSCFLIKPHNLKEQVITIPQITKHPKVLYSFYEIAQLNICPKAYTMVISINTDDDVNNNSKVVIPHLSQVS